MTRPGARHAGERPEPVRGRRRRTETVAVTVVIGAVVAAVLFVPRLISRPGDHRSDAAFDSSASFSPKPPKASATDGCWTAAHTHVDCRATHRYEVLPAGGECTMAKAMRYLGGRWLVDVPMRVRVIGWAGGRCAIDAGRGVQGSARNVLREPAPEWRQCVDVRKRLVVRCSQPHTGEYIGSGRTGRATPQECAAAAKTYINKAPAQYAATLRIDVLDLVSGAPVSQRCVVSARGGRLLTTTIRNLGVWPVPVTV